jgi:hypothetical protein
MAIAEAGTKTGSTPPSEGPVRRSRVVKCANCQQEFDRTGRDRPVAAIAVEVAGDEYIESFFFCAACGVYTQETYCDRFLGEETVSVSGPIAAQRGDALVELIRGCPDPMNKKCTCEVHRKFL